MRTPHRPLLALTLALCASCKTYVHGWRKLEPPYSESQVEAKRELWMSTADREERTMRRVTWGSDERGDYVEGFTDYQPMTLVLVDPVELMRFTWELVHDRSRDAERAPTRVYLADVRELRVQPDRKPTPEWHRYAVPFVWIALFAGIAIAVL